MGIWLEIRCENRSNPSSERVIGTNRERCWSHDNHSPMDMADDTQSSVIETLRDIGNSAREVGWQKTKFGWICPHCAAQPNALSELAAEAAEVA
jgi:hypothetical protein